MEGPGENNYYLQAVNAYSLLHCFFPIKAQWGWHYLYFTNEKIGIILKNCLRHTVTKQETPSLFDSKPVLLTLMIFIIGWLIYNLIFFWLCWKITWSFSNEEKNMCSLESNLTNTKLKKPTEMIHNYIIHVCIFSPSVYISVGTESLHLCAHVYRCVYVLRV